MYQKSEYLPHFGVPGRQAEAEPQHRAEPPAAKKQIFPADLLSRLALPLEIGILLVTAIAAYALVPGSVTAWFEPYLTKIALGTLLAINIFRLAGLYAPERLTAPATALGRLAMSWAGVAAAMYGLAFLSDLPGVSSRPWVMAWFALGLAGLTAMRLILAALARRLTAEGRFDRRVVIVGDWGAAQQLARHFESRPDNGVRVAGVFDDSMAISRGADPRQRNHAGYAEDLDALIERLRNEPVDSVIITLPDDDQDRFDMLRRHLEEVAVDVRLCPGRAAVRLAEADVSAFAGVATLNVADKPLRGWRSLVKEVEDRLIGGLITLLISPILLAIAIAIRLDSPGPVFFRQKRKGYNAQIIEVLKFRTMYVDKTDSDANRLTERNDPRVTRLGAFLRRWSLDELPQFLNVLRGEMSIVGPRPHALGAKAAGEPYDDVVPFYDARHRVKPGITGLAQIRGWRGPTDTRQQISKRVEYDIQYIENWSLWLDLKIIVQTALTGFKSENAF